MLLLIADPELLHGRFLENLSDIHYPTVDKARSHP
ncbi:hypothetical protein JOD27_007599 [Lentzea nigeriaca]|nr:hypothetical protein [Lentzea nigeriaca]